MRLGVGKRPTSPTVPKIVAARMGPTPKISVRVVPDVSTSALTRASRSAIFLSSVRMSRSTSEANRRRRRSEARSPGASWRAGCERPDRPRASRPPRRGRGP